jgi:hypothetical protein
VSLKSVKRRPKFAISARLLKAQSRLNGLTLGGLRVGQEERAQERAPNQERGGRAQAPQARNEAEAGVQPSRSGRARGRPKSRRVSAAGDVQAPLRRPSAVERGAVLVELGRRLSQRQHVRTETRLRRASRESRRASCGQGGHDLRAHLRPRRTQCGRAPLHRAGSVVQTV